ncbi:hypothetical protein [uncultured Nostoc sp.]|uniref:hypothetical protein n=1 Tax=uncultured Nostoc sp. TaxID=340711 RepID=UPI0035CC5059
MKEPATGNFFSGCWPNYQTNYSSLNCFGGLVLFGVGFGSYSDTLLDLLKLLASILSKQNLGVSRYNSG